MTRIPREPVPHNNPDQRMVDLFNGNVRRLIEKGLWPDDTVTDRRPRDISELEKEGFRRELVDRVVRFMNEQRPSDAPEVRSFENATGGIDIVNEPNRSLESKQGVHALTFNLSDLVVGDLPGGRQEAPRQIAVYYDSMLNTVDVCWYSGAPAVQPIDIVVHPPSSYDGRDIELL